MNPPGHRDKYTTIHQALTDAQLHEHLAGGSTYAAIIIGADELVSGACIELDRDTLDGARRVLEAATLRSVSAFAIATKGAGYHDGSHTWILFAERVQPERAAHLARQIATEAGYADAEIWPKGNAIRLPFGVHTHTQQRGRLILQSGETYDLQDVDQLSMGAAAVWALPKNAAAPELPKVEAPSMAHIAPTMAPRARGGRANHTTDDAIADQIRDVTERTIEKFKAENTLISLLEGDGAKETRDGYTCPHCTHTHETTLYISKHGRLFSYSPHCILHTTKGYDALGYYIKTRHNDDFRAAIDALSREYGFWFDARAARAALKADRQVDPPLVEPERRQQHAADAARKRDAWTREATAIRENISRLAESDERLTPCDRATLGAMLVWAAEHNAVSCWLGRAALAQRAGYSLGSVKRSVMLLEAYGYFASSGAGGRSIDTARRNFSRGSLTGQNDPRIDITRDLPTPDLELVSGALAAEPETLDQWEACEPDFDPADLAFLYDAEPPAAEPIAVDDAVGASYSPQLDQKRPRRRRAALPPKERDARAKARRQARFKAMGAPELRREWIILSRKADKVSNPAQRYALKEQVAEIEHYLALKDARLDRELAPPELPPAHKLAPEGRRAAFSDGVTNSAISPHVAPVQVIEIPNDAEKGAGVPALPRPGTLPSLLAGIRTYHERQAGVP